jgi:hypothetical protein
MENDLIRNYIEYGLDSIDKNSKTEILVQDLVLIHKTIQELISFFHQKKHYLKIEDVEKFIGNKESGMFSILCDINYKRLEHNLDESIKDILDSDDLIYPKQKYYQK